MIGRYPEHDVLAHRESWDPATRRVIDQRLAMAGAPLRFFQAAEEATVRAFADTCLGQDREPRIPVVELVDDQLAEGRLPGYRFDGMPDDREVWRRVLHGLDHTAKQEYAGETFALLDNEARRIIIDNFSKGKMRGGVWETMDSGRAWSVCMRSLLGAFYSHPWAWNEIGFGGPAYPEGFMRRGPVGTRDPHEAAAADDENPVPIADAMNKVK